MAVERQSATLPPPQPSAILRGHASQIHSVQFVRQNSRLLSGDAEGYVVYWQVETKRPLAVWKAHAGPILGFAQWSHDKIITHGRDNTLRVWQIRSEDDTGLPGRLSRTLPIDAKGRDLPKPWLKYAIPVNTLNFCSFSMCYQHPWQNEHIVGKGKERANSIPESESILVAVPATNDKMIDVYRLPGEQLKVKVPPVQVRSEEPGMVMAVKLVRHQASQNILLLAGYDGGVTAAFKLPGNCTGLATETAQLIYLSQPHSQPVLSLDALPDGSCYFTSSADAVIAMHKIPDLPYANNSKSSLLDKEGAPKATQEVEMMDKATEPSQRSRMSLSYIVEESPSASFAKQSVNLPSPATSKPSGVSSLLSSSVPLPRSKPVLQPMTTVQSPYKIVDSKHAGQQSLRVRSDGRLLVTGGWDARIRIYSTTTLKEVAVLKRHKEGVYAVAFNDILTVDDVRRKEDAKFVFLRAFREGGSEGMVRLGITPAEGWVEMAEGFATALAGGESKYKNDLVAFLMLPGMFDRLVQAGHGDGVKIRAQRQRDEQTKLKHYVAAGAKDGKISLWEVF